MADAFSQFAQQAVTHPEINQYLQSLPKGQKLQALQQMFQMAGNNGKMGTNPTPSPKPNSLISNPLKVHGIASITANNISQTDGNMGQDTGMPQQVIPPGAQSPLTEMDDEGTLELKKAAAGQPSMFDRYLSPYKTKPDGTAGNGGIWDAIISGVGSIGSLIGNDPQSSDDIMNDYMGRQNQMKSGKQMILAALIKQMSGGDTDATKNFAYMNKLTDPNQKSDFLKVVGANPLQQALANLVNR